MNEDEDSKPSRSAAERIDWERALLAGAVAAVFMAVLSVGGVALLVRAVGVRHAWIFPVFAVGAVVVSAALVPFTKRGKGPLVTVARRLPKGFDGGLRRRSLAAGLAGLLAVMAVVQVARLSCFMADPALRWGSAYPPVEFGVRHMCLAAYIYAADLTRSGVENVYAEELYPAYRSDETGGKPVTTGVANLAPYEEDAFEYPPPFLLLPRAALLLTNDFLAIRTGWFMLQVTVFVAFALFLASRVGGRRGAIAGLLLPGLLVSFPFMFNFQFGQFQLAAVVLSLGGMLAVSAKRDRLGGALLAAAIVTKLFPGLLLLYLAVRRRGRPILWTVVFAAVYALAGVLVLGPDPYRAFFSYHLPRIASGEAFSFFVKSDLALAANASVFSIPFKLGRLGVPGMSEALAGWLVWVYTALLVGITIVAARRRNAFLEPAVWLALLSLGALRSPEAPNVYVGTSALWLLTLLAVETRGRVPAVALFVVVWVCASVQPPLPDPKATIALWMSGQVAMLILGFWAVLRRQTGTVRGSRDEVTAEVLTG